MYGDQADKLIQSARQTASLARLNGYEGDLVRSVAREVKDLASKLEDLCNERDISESSQDRKAISMYILYRLALNRNKRCLLAYHHQRAGLLDQYVWNETDIPDSEISNLSPTELAYVKGYNDLITDMKSEWSDIDLTGSMDPPQKMYVEVRVLQDAGEIQTEYGVFNLTKDSQFFVRQADVQRLIQQGLVQLV